MTSNIKQVIAEAYEEADLPQPSMDISIAPLDQLIRSHNLARIELTGLTGLSAAQYLIQRGTAIELPTNLNEDALAGFLYVSPKFGSIFVERNDLMVRRRFSAAHELGHYLLHFCPLLRSLSAEETLPFIEVTDALPRSEDADPNKFDLPLSSINVCEESDFAQLLPPLEEMEREANEFAAELLMPEDVVRSLTAEREADFRENDLVWRLATEMLVSQAAMKWRLLHLRIIEDERSVN